LTQAASAAGRRFSQRASSALASGVIGTRRIPARAVVKLGMGAPLGIQAICGRGA
jgi:hypothetical protein